MDCVNTDAAARLALARSPETTLERFKDLLLEFPSDVISNPAFRVGLVADPSFVGRLSPLGMALLGVHEETAGILAAVRGLPQPVARFLADLPEIRSEFGSLTSGNALAPSMLCPSAHTPLTAARELMAVVQLVRSLGVSRLRWEFGSSWSEDSGATCTVRRLALGDRVLNPDDPRLASLERSLRLLLGCMPDPGVANWDRDPFDPRGQSWVLHVDNVHGASSATARPCPKAETIHFEFERFDCPEIRSIETLLGTQCSRGLLVALWGDYMDDEEGVRVYKLDTSESDWDAAFDAMFPNAGLSPVNIAFEDMDEEYLAEEVESVELSRKSLGELKNLLDGYVERQSERLVAKFKRDFGPPLVETSLDCPDERALVMFHGRVALVDLPYRAGTHYWFQSPEVVVSVERG